MIPVGGKIEILSILPEKQRPAQMLRTEESEPNGRSLKASVVCIATGIALTASAIALYESPRQQKTINEVVYKFNVQGGLSGTIAARKDRSGGPCTLNISITVNESSKISTKQGHDISKETADVLDVCNNGKI